MAEFLPSDRCDAAVAEFERLEMADLDDVIALPATRDLVSHLPSGRWAAVTSGSQLLMRARLAAAGLPVPDVLVAAEDVRLGKPDPQGYLDAARRLGFDPRRCLVVEDAPAGLEAGRAAGAWSSARQAESTAPSALHHRGATSSRELLPVWGSTRAGTHDGAPRQLDVEHRLRPVAPAGRAHALRA